MRKLFRIIVAIPCWLFLQSIGTLAFTLMGIGVILLPASIGLYILYLGTGNKDKLEEANDTLLMFLSVVFAGSLTTWSWIQTGDFDIENFGMTHLEKK